MRPAPPARTVPAARAFARVGPLPPREAGARNPPGVPGRRSLRCQRAGEQDARAGSQFFRTPVTWRPALFAFGSLDPEPGLARGLGRGEVGRVRPSPDPLPAPKGRPAVVRGGRIS